MKFYTLSQVAMSIKAMVQEKYPHHYWVKLEIAKLNLYAKSGHCYPELVEKEHGIIKAQFRGTIWNESYYKINKKLQEFANQELADGIILLAKVQVTYTSNYGIAINIVDIDENFQLGELAKEKSLSIKKLKEENIFDKNKQLEFPILPQRLAIISIETSKGYSDFNTIIQNHSTYQIEQTLFQAILQGDKAVESIMHRLEKIATEIEKFDAVLIIRGGGDDVGMTCYDNYQLAKSIANFPLPILTGIGHSTNETVSEMVAYSNKITPTELAYFILSFFEFQNDFLVEFQTKLVTFSTNLLKENKLELKDLQKELKILSNEKLNFAKEELSEIQSEIKILAQTKIEKEKSIFQLIENKMSNASTTKLKTEQQNLITIKNRFLVKTQQLIVSKQHEIQLAEQKIELVNPDKILKRGFIIAKRNNQFIKSKNDLAKGDKITLVLKDGEKDAEII